MAGMAEKLYPPTINGSLPAFYSENGTAKIVVPFSMNRAVVLDNSISFALKIKTAQSNKLIEIVYSNSHTENEAVFYSTTLSNKIKIGQFLKVQLAYVQTNQSVSEIGYYSTVGIIKYTSKPKVYIENLGEENNKIEIFHSEYTGIYEPGEDKTERPYSYKFSLYNYNLELVETSGWQLHNTTINNIASESMSLEKATDIYNFNTNIKFDTEYYLQYSVKTINGLEINSPLYLCLEPSTEDSTLEVNLQVENIFDEGYIKLFFEKKNDDFTALEKPISIEICRAEKTDNFNSWQVLQKIYFDSYQKIINWVFKDFCIEQGVIYKYCFRQYNNMVKSNRVESKKVMADFEDMFLYDGERQLKIRFNPKVSSFKINRLEQKTDTIGSRYPFIFRNGVVEYKEFPISGLISYYMDNNELFVNHKDDLHIILGSQASRWMGTPVESGLYENNVLGDTVNENDNFENSWETSETLNSVGYNMRAERRFKLKLLEWLGNGQIKMFKSPAEGNYLVRLMNISLSPEDRLSRMLHTFSCTAYEMKEYNYNNLKELGFFNLNENSKTEILNETIQIKNLLTNEQDINSLIKINQNSPIYEKIDIWISPETGRFNNSFGFYVRFGLTSQTKILVSPSRGFHIYDKEHKLSDLYFCIADNLELIDYQQNEDFSETLEKIKDLVGDAQLDYQYLTTNQVIGEFNDIIDNYLTTEIKTLNGPSTLTLNSLNTNPKQEFKQELLKIYTLNFKEKPIYKILKRKEHEEDEDFIYTDITSADPLQWIDIIDLSTLDKYAIYEIYVIDENNPQNYEIESYNYINQLGQFNTITYLTDEGEKNILSKDLIDTSIVLLPKKENNDNNYFIDSPPIIDVVQSYDQIKIGVGVYLECAYLNKTTVKKRKLI